MINGHPLPPSFQRTTGFVEQMDIHEATATVREAFQFSALMRRPQSVPIQEKYDLVEEIIDLLEMTKLADVVIGTPGAGLDPNQRKRVTIGVELCSKPDSLIFLDEVRIRDSGSYINHVLNSLQSQHRALIQTPLLTLCAAYERSPMQASPYSAQFINHQPSYSNASTTYCSFKPEVERSTTDP